VALSDSGEMFVADATYRVVLKYDSQGRLAARLRPSERDGATFEPSAVLIHGGVLFVADRAERRVARYDLASQEWLSDWKPSASDTPLVAPAGLAMTEPGILLVSDAYAGVVRRVDASGAWLSSIGRRGRRRGELVRPIGVCATRGGLICVADAAKQSILVFNSEGQPLTEIDADLTLPCGIVPLPDAWREVLSEPASRDEKEEWLAVSDTLGEEGIKIIGLTLSEGTTDKVSSRDGE
jgi:hypothetical protein